MIIYKRRQEAKQKRRERRAKRRAKRQARREVTHTEILVMFVFEPRGSVPNSNISNLLCLTQRRAQSAAGQLSGVPVLSVEQDADWDDTGLSEDDADKAEVWTERENGTVFVIPTSPQLLDSPCRWEYLKGGEPDSTSLSWLSDLQEGDTTTLASSSEDTLSRDLERVSLGSLGKWTWDIHSIILDMSTANFIDTVATKTIKNVGIKTPQVSVHKVLPVLYSDLWYVVFYDRFSRTSVKST